MVRAPWGSDHRRDLSSSVELLWESRPERVKAPYTKDETAQWYPEYIETRGTLMEHAGTTP